MWLWLKQWRIFYVYKNSSHREKIGPTFFTTCAFANLEMVLECYKGSTHPIFFIYIYTTKQKKYFFVPVLDHIINKNSTRQQQQQQLTLLLFELSGCSWMSLQPASSSSRVSSRLKELREVREEEREMLRALDVAHVALGEHASRMEGEQ